MARARGAVGFAGRSRCEGSAGEGSAGRCGEVGRGERASGLGLAGRRGTGRGPGARGGPAGRGGVLGGGAGADWPAGAGGGRGCGAGTGQVSGAAAGAERSGAPGCHRGAGAGAGCGVPGRWARGAEPGGGPGAMRRSSTDESTYRRSPSPEGKEPGFARGGPFRRYSSLYGRAGAGDGGDGSPFFGLHANPGPKAAQARYTSPKGNKYVVFYLDLSFIFLLELKRCSMARGCLQGVKFLMFAFNLLFWVSGGGAAAPGRQEERGRTESRRSSRDGGRAART